MSGGRIKQNGGQVSRGLAPALLSPNTSYCGVLTHHGKGLVHVDWQ